MKRLFLALALLCASPCFAQLVLTANLAGQVNAPIDQNGWQSFKVTLTQNITFSFVILPLGTPPPAQSTLRVIFVQDAVGNRTVTFASNISSPCALATTANSITICQFSFDGTSSTWIGISSGAGIVASSQNVILARDKGVIADGLVVYDASWTNNANPVVVTSATANFSASRDNNKTCLGVDSSSGINSAPVGTLTVVNSTTANCSGTATATSTASAFAWGTDDTAAWLVANAAAAASQAPTCIVGPNGNTLVAKAPLIDPRSSPTWSWCFSGPTGGLTTFIPEGLSFDPTTCTGPVASACIWEPHQGNIVQNIVPQYSKLDNIAVNGLTFRCTAGYSGKAAFGLQHTEGHNIWAWNWCGTAAGQSSFSGITLNAPNSVYNLNANNTGGSGFNFASLAAPTQTFLAASYSGAQGNGSDITIGSNNIVVSKGNFWQQCTTQCVIVSAGATMVMDGDTGTGNSGNQYVDVFGTLVVEGGTQINPANNSGSTILTRATGKAFIQDAVIKETGTSGVALNVNTVPGGSIINRGNVSTTGIDQTLLVAANVVLSAGWGTTATVTNLSGTPDSNPTRFSFQANSSGTGQAANPTMAITYPASTATTPVWTCKQSGGTGALTVISGESGASATAMTLTFNGTPVAASNYIITCTGSLQ